VLVRVFKSGNSMDLRIPKELAFAETIQEVETERIGNARSRPFGRANPRRNERGNQGRLRLFLIDSGNCVLCLFSPEKPCLSLISSLHVRPHKICQYL
jgi:hypothetical protein